MKVRSKLADIDFQFGTFEYKKDHLIVHSHPDQAMQSRVYISPVDILTALRCAAKNWRVWRYFFGFPFFYIRYRRRHAAKRAEHSSS